MRSGLRAAAIVGAIISSSASAANLHQLSCDALIGTDVLSAHSGHAWRQGKAIVLQGDLATCNYYQEEVPAGLSLGVRNDPERKDLQNARETFARELQPAPGLPGEAFFYRHRALAPFADSWGLVVHSGGRTYRLEGVPEANNAEQAQKVARDIIERALTKFSKS